MSRAEAKKRGGAPAGNRNAVGNPGGSGRPTKYQDDMPARAYKLALLGLTDAEVAVAFGVSETTINAWKVQYVDFSEALLRGKTEADGEIAHSLYHRAKGYSHDAVKIAVNAQGEVTQVPFTEHYPPDTAAARHWLNNRQPRYWRDRIEHTGADGGAIQIERRSLDPRLLNPDQREVMRQVLATALEQLGTAEGEVIEGEYEEKA